MANCPTSGGTLVVSDVDCTQTAFNYDPAVTQRNGMVTIRLTLTRAGESVRLYDRVTINNAP